ncbi:MAG: hypothetical protein JW976_04825 [Syntrophaceae bacterium]|nr:hypothetical protein [Syntrophaceae bacterium]
MRLPVAQNKHFIVYDQSCLISLSCNNQNLFSIISCKLNVGSRMLAERRTLEGAETNEFTRFEPVTCN